MFPKFMAFSYELCYELFSFKKNITADYQINALFAAFLVALKKQNKTVKEIRSYFCSEFKKHSPIHYGRKSESEVTVTWCPLVRKREMNVGHFLLVIQHSLGEFRSGFPWKLFHSHLFPR